MLSLCANDISDSLGHSQPVGYSVPLPASLEFTKHPQGLFITLFRAIDYRSDKLLER